MIADASVSHLIGANPWYMCLVSSRKRKKSTGRRRFRITSSTAIWICRRSRGPNDRVGPENVWTYSSALCSREQGRTGRRESRVAVTPAAASLWMPSRPAINAEIVNVSRNGLRLSTAIPVMAGSTVAVILGQLPIDGSVTYCKEINGQHSVGIRITKVTHQPSDKDL